MKNNLPKSWAVLNDGSQLFKDTVIKYLNDTYQNNFSGDEVDSYYGISDGKEEILPTKFGKILTLQKFISITEEKQHPVTAEEVYRDFHNFHQRLMCIVADRLTPEQRVHFNDLITDMNDFLIKTNQCIRRKSII